MNGPYTLDDFFAWKKQQMPARSVVIRLKVARQLVKLASRIGRHPSVGYTISHHHPSSWDRT